MKKFALLALLGAAAAGAAAVCVKVIKDRKSNLDADYTECPLSLIHICIIFGYYNFH